MALFGPRPFRQTRSVTGRIRLNFDPQSLKNCSWDHERAFGWENRAFNSENKTRKQESKASKRCEISCLQTAFGRAQVHRGNWLRWVPLGARDVSRVSPRGAMLRGQSRHQRGQQHHRVLLPSYLMYTVLHMHTIYLLYYNHILFCIPSASKASKSRAFRTQVSKVNGPKLLTNGLVLLLPGPADDLQQGKRGKNTDDHTTTCFNKPCHDAGRSVGRVLRAQGQNVLEAKLRYAW